MANKVLLKKSSVAAKVPLTTDLDYGELALNYTDGKQFYKTASNTIDTFASISATATLTNKTLTSPVISGGTINNAIIGGTTAAAGTFTTLNASGLTTLTGEVLINNAGGAGGTSEGGELHFAIPTANTTLSGPIAIDIYQNKIRFFETTGQLRGAYIDLTGAGANVTSNLLSGGSTQTAFTTITVAGQSDVVADSGTDILTLTAGSGIGITTNAVSDTITFAIDSTVTTLTGTQTLTNKTINLTNNTLVATSAQLAAAVTDETGSGSLVFATSPTLVTPNIGAATGTSLSVSGSLTSTVATGTAPLVVTSTTKVANLNVEQVDGYHADPLNTASTLVVRDASKNIAVSGVVLAGATSGTSTLVASAAAGTTTHTLPAVTGTIVTSGDTGTVTNTMLAGSIANAKLVNSTISGIALGSNLGTLTIGTGLSGTSYNGSTGVTIAIDSTVTTLTGSQTLTNKTLTYPVIDNIKWNMTQTATAAGTTTLTVTSNMQQRFTGTTTQTVVLPVTSTLTAGTRYLIENASTGNITVNSSGGNLVSTVIPGTTVEFSCIGTTLTTAADWDAEYFSFSSITGTGACVLGTSPTISTSIIAGTTSLDVFNTTATTVNAFGAATALSLGAATGTTTVNNNMVVTGNLTVNGTTTTINATTITVDDINIELGSVASPTDTTANGGGLTLKGATDKTFNWVQTTGFWTSNVGISAPTLISTVATGTAPLTVTSTTKVANLNVEQVDGYHADTANTASTLVVRDASKNISTSDHIFSGATSGTTTLKASAVASGTITMPANTGTMALVSDIITTSDTAPTTPADNRTWVDSANGNLNIFYNDSTSTQWVNASSGMSNFGISNFDGGGASTSIWHIFSIDCGRAL